MSLAAEMKQTEAYGLLTPLRIGFFTDNRIIRSRWGIGEMMSRACETFQAAQLFR